MAIGLFFALALVLSYLAGSLPFGLLLGRAAGVDIRRRGSGNIGATNLWRICGWRWGLPAFLLDAAKGALPALLFAPWMHAHMADAAPERVTIVRVTRIAAAGEEGAKTATYAEKRGPFPAAAEWIAIGCAVAAVLGHNFPVWLRFKGGKGVATSLGAMAALLPWPTLAGFAAFAAVVAWKRYVSLGSLAGTLVFFAATAVLETRPEPGAGRWPLIGCAFVLSLLVVVRHRHNIARLRAGTEPRFSWGSANTREGGKA